MEDPGPPVAATAPAAATPKPAHVPPHTVERITAIERRAPNLLYFTTTRPAAYTFTPGHYGRLGLGRDDDIVWRPYSIASPADDASRLAFQLTCAPGGKFTGHFCAARVGDAIRVDQRSFGFLTLDTVAPGGALWMLSTGTGLAPFLAMIADPRTFSRHERAILVHSVRHAAELSPDAIEAATARLDAAQKSQLTVIPVVTREAAPGALNARLGALLTGGEIEKRVDCAIEPAGARVMLCGNPDMIKEVRQLMRERGLEPGRRGIPGQLATEGYW